jgi:hemerythrin
VALSAWSDHFSVGVKTIDQQHSSLFAIVNELHDSMTREQANQVLGALLDKLAKGTVENFAYEERMMEATEFPGLASHRAHHAELTRQVNEFMARHERGDGAVNILLLRFLSDWFASHIQLENKEYGPWVSGHSTN